MLANLEQIRREALQVTTKVGKVRNGYERKGHWRHYQDGHSVWIEAMDVSSYNVTIRRGK